MLIVGSLLLGVGFGMFVDNTGAGALVGLGVGFILEFLSARTGIFRAGRGCSPDASEPRKPED